jgi:hypothetical protein
VPRASLKCRRAPPAVFPPRRAGDLPYGAWSSRACPSRPRECEIQWARLGNRTGWDEDEIMRQAEMAPSAPKETLCPTRSVSVNSRARSERPRRAGREAPPTLPRLTRRAWTRATGKHEHEAARIVLGGCRRASSGRARSASSPVGALSAANVKDPSSSAGARCAAGWGARAAAQVRYGRKERGSWENVPGSVDERSSAVAASCAGGSGGAVRASRWTSCRARRADEEFQQEGATCSTRQKRRGC